MKWWNKMVNKIKEPKKNKKLTNWQAKYEDSKAKYADTLSRMVIYEGYYNGTRKVMRADDSGYADKEATNIRNIVFELLESEVDVAIPMPKVKAIHEEDTEQAKIIEEYIKSEINLTKLKILNDQQERTTTIQGGSFNLVEWDNTKGFHCTVGDLLITDVHPRQFIPQPGITDIDKMDYMFIRTPQTKGYVKRRFGVDVEAEQETDKEIRDEIASEDIVTVITCYYKNKDNGIGIYRWCGDVELEDNEDYQARMRKVCKKCGKPQSGDVCECGSKTFVEEKDDMATVTLYEQRQTSVLPDGTPLIEDVEVDVEVEYYKPNVFPIVLRKNISKDKSLLGRSDVDVISDQQESVKKFGTKINEKTLTGGSFVTLPEGVAVELTDQEMKVLRLSNPAQKALIDVITVQADTTQDRINLEENYQWAKSSLGITDSYQGKYDSSATSGTAKQYAINQAAGRLESKRVMKNEAYAKLYEIMFKFALAYADDPVPLTIEGANGTTEFAHFDKRAFLKQDKAGDWYWNDEFLFDIDPTSTLLTNREAMWNQADIKLQSGAYGPLGDLETNYMYWAEQERNGYPNAGANKEEIMRRIAEIKQQAAAQAQPTMGMEGDMQNGMPVM